MEYKELINDVVIQNAYFEHCEGLQDDNEVYEVLQENAKSYLRDITFDVIDADSDLSSMVFTKLVDDIEPPELEEKLVRGTVQYFCKHLGPMIDKAWEDECIDRMVD